MGAAPRAAVRARQSPRPLNDTGAIGVAVLADGAQPASLAADRLAVQAQATLQAAVPSEVVYELHRGLIWHGRQVCVPHRPFCSQCALRDLCPRVGVVESR